MDKVDEYLDVMQRMVSLIPAYPGTPAGDEFSRCTVRLAELVETMTEEEGQELDARMDRFYATEAQ